MLDIGLAVIQIQHLRNVIRDKAVCPVDLCKEHRIRNQIIGNPFVREIEIASLLICGISFQRILVFKQRLHVVIRKPVTDLGKRDRIPFEENEDSSLVEGIHKAAQIRGFSKTAVRCIEGIRLFS